MKKRDIQIHAAVTIMPNVNNVQLIGSKENEIAQFAVQIDARNVPLTHTELKVAFDGLYYHCLEKMRRHGLLKAGC